MYHVRLERRLLSTDRASKRAKTLNFVIDALQGSDGLMNALLARACMLFSACDRSFGVLDLLVQVKEIKDLPKTKREEVPYDLMNGSCI